MFTPTYEQYISKFNEIYRRQHNAFEKFVKTLKHLDACAWVTDCDSDYEAFAGWHYNEARLDFESQDDWEASTPKSVITFDFWVKDSAGRQIIAWDDCRVYSDENDAQRIYDAAKKVIVAEYGTPYDNGFWRDDREYGNYRRMTALLRELDDLVDAALRRIPQGGKESGKDASHIDCTNNNKGANMAIINYSELSDGALDNLIAEARLEKVTRQQRYLMTDGDLATAKNDINRISDSIKNLAANGYKVWYSELDHDLYVTKDTVMMEYAPADYIDSSKNRVMVNVHTDVGWMGCEDYQFVRIPKEGGAE